MMATAGEVEVHLIEIRFDLNLRGLGLVIAFRRFGKTEKSVPINDYGYMMTVFL